MIKLPVVNTRLVVRVASLVLASVAPHVLTAQAQGDGKATARTQAIQVDRNSAALGSVLPFDERFIFTGAASASLLKLEVTYAESTVVSPGKCELRNKAETAKLSKSTWERTSSAATTFWLPVNALLPNTPYTFCFRSIDALSATDSAAFVAEAAAGIKQAVRAFLDAHIVLRDADLGALHDTLHSALRRSLSHRDTIVIPKGSILGPMPTDPAEKQKFEERLVSTFGALSNDVGNRATPATRFEDRRSRSRVPIHPAIPGKPTKPEVDMCNPDPPTPVSDADCTKPLAWMLRELARDSALSSLVVSGKAFRGMPAADSVRLLAAASLALSIRGMTGGNAGAQASSVAGGLTTITDLRIPTEANPELTKQWSTAEITRWATNLDTTIIRLRDLRDLTTLLLDRATVAKDTAAMRKLAHVQPLLNSIYDDMSFQRGDLRQVADALGSLDKNIARIVGNLAGRELAETGLPFTTSANYEARARWHVGQEIGVTYAWRGDSTRQASPYLGVSIYLTPINKRAPKPARCKRDVRCSASISLGVPTEKWEVENKFAGILDGRPLIVGVGTRIGDFFRVSYSFPLVYSYKFSDDGKSRRRQLSAMNSISFALDADLREIISGLAGAIFPK